MEKSLCEIIKVDEQKCTNCHLCIGVCPAKYCNNASNPDKGIQLNSSLCIGCGACLKACSHDARYIVDDTEKFINDLKSGKKISTLAAPAVDVNFPGKLNNLLSWFKSIGVYMNFDVSFGAEITTYQYIKAIKEGVKTPVIAQPCPSIVNYIEVYKPNLIKYLSPVGSPAMNMARWVNKKYPDTGLAFISPCIAKKREFEDENTDGIVQYNVTILGLKNYFENNNIKLEDYDKVGFDGPMEAERGILYSQPGGLLENVKRYNVSLKMHQVRKTEGIEVYEEFFEELEKDLEKNSYDVVVVDILNCLHGCNRGTGTKYYERSTDEVLKLQTERLEHQNELYSNSNVNLKDLDGLLENMEEIDFSRKYTDRSSEFDKLETPSEEIEEIINHQMGKYEEKDIKNCGACGYMSCSKMTKAVLNGLYNAEQCHHFLESQFLKCKEKEEIKV